MLWWVSESFVSVRVVLGPEVAGLEPELERIAQVAQVVDPRSLWVPVIHVFPVLSVLSVLVVSRVGVHHWVSLWVSCLKRVT